MIALMTRLKILGLERRIGQEDLAAVEHEVRSWVNDLLDEKMLVDIQENIRHDEKVEMIDLIDHIRSLNEQVYRLGEELAEAKIRLVEKNTAEAVSEVSKQTRAHLHQLHGGSKQEVWAES